MTEKIYVLKDAENQQPVPTEWRSTFSGIVEAFRDGDLEISRGVGGVRRISQKKAAKIAGNIKNYGAHLLGLPEESWETSACQWMGSYWDVLVDLFTVEEGASDLVLFVRVFEDGATYNFEVQSVHVP